MEYIIILIHFFPLFYLEIYLGKLPSLYFTLFFLIFIGSRCEQQMKIVYNVCGMIFRLEARFDVFH